MVNEYGARLDRNGYAPSIIQPDGERCWMCGMQDQKLDRHEAFPGPFRTKAKRLGLWVLLCSDRCHHGGVHKYRRDALVLKQTAERAAMIAYDWDLEKFIKEFGKNYLEV